MTDTPANTWTIIKEWPELILDRLSDAGVANSKQLHLTERLRLLDDGRYLRYQATATDPEVLVHPATYTRYFVRSNQEITEDNCFRLLPKSPQQISRPAPQSKHPGETR